MGRDGEKQVRSDTAGVWESELSDGFMELSHLAIWIKKPQSEKCGYLCFVCSLHACFPVGDILKTLMSCLK